MKLVNDIDNKTKINIFSSKQEVDEKYIIKQFYIVNKINNYFENIWKQTCPKKCTMNLSGNLKLTGTVVFC